MPHVNTKAILIKAVTPRAFEHYRRTIGAGSRLEIQAAQYLKRAVALARIVMPQSMASRFDPSIASFEARIQYLQVDQEVLRSEHAELQALVIQYKSWFEHSPMGFHVLDPQGKIKDVNQKWLDLLGYERKDEVVGEKTIFDFITKGPEQRDNAIERFRARLSGVPEKDLPKKLKDREYMRKDGKIIYVETVDTVFKDKDGNVSEVQTSFQDVTGRIVAQKALEEAQKTIIEQEKSAAVGMLAGNFSHEYKNQVITLKSQIDRLVQIEEELSRLYKLALEKSINEQVRRELVPKIELREKQLRLIENQISTMDRYIKGILSLANSGLTDREVVNVKEKIKEIIAKLNDYAASHGVVLTADNLSLRDNDGVLISELGFEIIMVNLAGNAIEACIGSGRKGNVEITVGTIEGNLKISIIDNGCGIAPEILSQLFKGPVRSTKHPGNGRGLNLVAQIVESASGFINAQSAAGVGTTFTIVFPISKAGVSEKAATDAGEIISREKASKITVLVVDDEEWVLELNQERLGNLGFKVAHASSGEEALLFFRGKGNRPDIVLTDQTMPGMFGHELIEKIAQIASPPPVFIINTGDTSLRGDRRAADVVARHNCFVMEKVVSGNDFNLNISRIIFERLGDKP